MTSQWIRTPARRSMVLGAALVLALPAALSAADPFYELRLEEGVRAWAGGGYERAIRDLRIACFGLLEEPEPLARCLTYLALAQAGAGDREAFSATFLRILEVEQRFEAYSRVELEPGVRRAFEARLELWEPYEALRSAPAFAAVARRVLEARILSLPPAERRQELERRLAGEPEDAVWQLLTAELELAAGNFEPAAAAADAVLAELPAAGDPAFQDRRARALCVRGRALAALGGCETALRGLPACAPLAIDVTETTLQCYAQLRDWKRGMVLLSELPPETRRKPAVRKLAKLFERERRLEIRQIARQEDAGVPRSGVPRSGAPEPVPADPPAPTPAEPPTEPERDPPDGESPPELAPQIEAARRLLGASDRREELTELFARMAAAADRYPEHRELQYVAAEVAYRLRRWDDVLAYLERGGGSGRPDHRFYRAVALYETGDRAAAARDLDLCLAYLEPTDLVRRYAAQILGDER